MRILAALVFLLIAAVMTAQTADFKVMTYNLMYYKDQSAPCSQSISFAQKDQAFKTVFQAVDPDIMCVNELVGFNDNSGAQSILNNVINTDGEINFTSAAYSNNSFSSITNMLFYDSTMFGLASQDYVSSTPNNISLVRVIDFYRLYYKDPALKLGADTVFVTIAAAHLKAGNSSSDRNDRQLAAAAAMDYITNQVPDENVIFTGDLNVYTGTEGAYQELVNYSVASERFVDPGVPGSWNNNSTYAILHTQSTHAFSSGCYSGGGLDDRFDFILNSQAIANGTAGLAYKLNSMMAIGNDGAHFNQSINSGSNSAVSPTVANALYDFSDHLPVVAEYRVTLSDIRIPERLIADLSYNNPVKDVLHISGLPADQNINLQILELSGRILFNTTLQNDRERIELNLSFLPGGVYLLHIQDDWGRHATMKVLKSDF
jgi:endonuclease/exonuclease/phosphatase family metal-dependent hydrolase